MPWRELRVPVWFGGLQPVCVPFEITQKLWVRLIILIRMTRKIFSCLQCSYVFFRVYRKVETAVSSKALLPSYMASHPDNSNFYAKC